MLGKVVVSVVSVLLVVGIAIGVVSVVNRKDSAPVTPQMKAVRSVCQTASNQAECVKTLENVKSSDPKDLVKELVVATKKAMMKSYNYTDEMITKVAGDGPDAGRRKAALQYCKRVFDYSLMDLQEFIDTIGGDVSKIGEKYYYLQQWLMNTWVYQSDCLNDILDEDLLKNMEGGVQHARVLTGNAMDVVSKLNQIMASFNINVNFNTTAMSLESGAPAPGAGGRRLLESVEDGFPTWLSAADRKLLAKAGRKDGGGVQPNFVVAQDGSGQFKTVSEAVNACPEKNPGRCVIYIKAGLYREQVIIPKTKNNVFMYGDGARKTIITYNRSVKLSPNTVTSTSGTVQVESPGFMAKWIGIKNTAGPEGHQAVALRINGDQAVVFNCRMDGYQDTLYVDSGHQFYRNCVVSGTVDFIFGESATIIQNSLIIVRVGSPGQFNTITADGNQKGPAGKHTGIVIQNCRILPDKKLAIQKTKVRSYLGRPWKPFATTIIMQTEIGDFIHPEGWMIWEGKDYHQTCFYREFQNYGPGARTDLRAKWPGLQITTRASDMVPYTLQNWVLQPIDWIRPTGTPYKLGL